VLLHKVDTKDDSCQGLPRTLTNRRQFDACRSCQVKATCFACTVLSFSPIGNERYSRKFEDLKPRITTYAVDEANVSPDAAGKALLFYDYVVDRDLLLINPAVGRFSLR